MPAFGEEQAEKQPIVQECRAQLSFKKAPGAKDCPDEQELRNAISAKLGYDPFCSLAPLKLRASVSRNHRLYAGDIYLQDSRTSLGHRRISGNYTRCSQLVSALALAISIAIDPLGSEQSRKQRELPARTQPAPQQPPPEPPAQPPPSQIVVVLPSDTSSASQQEKSIVFNLDAGADLLIGALPKTAFGIQIGSQANWSSYSVRLEGFATFPIISSFENWRIKSSTIQFAAVPCVRGNWFAGCAVLAGGVIRAEGLDLSPSRKATSPSLSLGLRGELKIPLVVSSYFLIHASVNAPLIRTEASIGNSKAWSSPRIFENFGAVLGWEL